VDRSVIGSRHVLGTDSVVPEASAAPDRPWGGAGYMPELLAAFSVPNDPVVDRILGNAADVMRRAGRPGGIDGYQSGRREPVWEIAAAVYTAVANLGLNYATPPASFKRYGQKIRLPGQIMDSGQGTCLDLTMLFCSALEEIDGAPFDAVCAFSFLHLVPDLEKVLKHIRRQVKPGGLFPLKSDVYVGSSDPCPAIALRLTLEDKPDRCQARRRPAPPRRR